MSATSRRPSGRTTNRARLATAPDRSALLDTIGRAEHALAVLRRDLLAGGSPETEAAAAELAALAARLRTRAVPPAGVDVPPAREPGLVPTVMEPVTAPVSGLSPMPEPSAPRRALGVASGVDIAAVDLDTVRVGRAADYEISGAWVVLAGPADEPVGLGTLRPGGGRGRRWETRTSAGAPAGEGPWSSRQDALVGLVMHYRAVAEIAAGRRSRRH